MHLHANIQAGLEKRFNKSMLNRKEMAEFLSVSLGTITNLIKDEKIPYLKLGVATSTIRFDVVSIAQWVEGMSTKEKYNVGS